MNRIRNAFFNFLCIIVTLLAVFFCGYYYGSQSAEPGIVYRDKIITKTIYRDYPSLTRSDCIEKLSCYDMALPALDIIHKDSNRYELSAGLCERKWKRDIEIELARSGNWKYYICAGIATGALVAYFVLK